MIQTALISESVMSIETFFKAKTSIVYLIKALKQNRLLKLNLALHFTSRVFCRPLKIIKKDRKYEKCSRDDFVL